MKTVYKIVYYITIAFSAFLLCLIIIAPFSGIRGIFIIVKEGFFIKTLGDGIFALRLGQFIAGAFMLTCVLSILLPFTRFQQKNKHQIAFVFFLIFSSIVLMGLMIKYFIE